MRKFYVVIFLIGGGHPIQYSFEAHSYESAFMTASVKYSEDSGDSKMNHVDSIKIIWEK